MVIEMRGQATHISRSLGETNLDLVYNPMLDDEGAKTWLLQNTVDKILMAEFIFQDFWNSSLQPIFVHRPIIVLDFKSK